MQELVILCALVVEAGSGREGDCDNAEIIIKRNRGWPEETFF